MRAPEFWQRDGLMPRILAPAGWLYAAAGRAREACAAPFRAPVPVICVGNLTVGGTGKTPIAIAIAERLRAHDRRVAFLTRGHGGSEAGPLRVDPARHDARQVGDEPLLLAAVAPTIVARDRAAGARAAAAAGAETIVMDDGLQNPGIVKDRRLVVVDGETGFGNARVLPAGPLRETLARGLARADAFVLVGDDRRGLAAALAARATVLRARLEPVDGERFAGRRLLAFAGIGRPAKFFATLEALDAQLVGRESFADHHVFAAAELARLRAAAARCDAALVTTAKDLARLPPRDREGIDMLAIAAAFDDPARLDALIAVPAS